jgi:DNA polymerase-3 subunit delta
MGVTSLQAFQNAVTAQRFAPAYYLSGDDEHRKDALVRQVIETAVDAAVREFNVDVVRGSEADVQRLEPMLQTLPMLAARRVVVVRDTGSLRKDVRAQLERYLESPAPDTVLVLVALAGTKEEREFSHATQLTVSSPTGDGFGAWVVEHVRDVHGASITSKAVQLLEESVGRDTVLLASEIDKLVSYAGGQMIDDAAVSAVTGIRRGKTLGDLLDAVAARNAGAALGLIEDVLTVPKNNAVTVIMALTVQTLAMTWGHYARGRVDYFALLKETSAFPMRPWGEAAKCWASNQSRWNSTNLHSALRALREADQAAKDTRVASDEQLVATLICAMCAEPSRAAA